MTVGFSACAEPQILRAVLAAADAGEAHAQLAYAVYLHRLRAQIAGMAAAMGGMDGLVFTGGAGEGSARLRRDACMGLGLLASPWTTPRTSGQRHLTG